MTTIRSSQKKLKEHQDSQPKMFKDQAEFNAWYDKYYELESLKKDYPNKADDLSSEQQKMHKDKMESFKK